MSVLGTWAYMPPEVMKMSVKNSSKTHYDGRKYDVYSFSMIMYFMWARREPFFNISYARLPLEITLGNARPSVSYIMAGAGDNGSLAASCSSASHSSNGESHNSSTQGSSTKMIVPREERFEPQSLAVPNPLLLTVSSRKTLALMSRCWSSDLRKRPQFQEIHSTLQTIAPKAILDLEHAVSVKTELEKR